MTALTDDCLAATDGLQLLPGLPWQFQLPQAEGEPTPAATTAAERIQTRLDGWEYGHLPGASLCVETADLRQVLREHAERTAALRNLLTAVENMKCPQTIADVGFLIIKFHRPIEVARAALRSPAE